MKRILFVDDELKVLQGLQRMLRSMRHEWEMEFATGGQEALAMLEKSPFDVIVTDMRMPGMNGAQLLDEVMKQYPHVVRIILSGQTDQDVFMSSCHTVHQFLSKPCDTETLKTTIARAFALKELLKDESLRKLVLKTESLPSLSDLCEKIVGLLKMPDVPMEKIGQIIAKDIGMTAKILQLVNSAYYGIRRHISNPTEAVVALGLNTIKALVLSHRLFRLFDNTKFTAFSPQSLWQHSMEVGLLARKIARMENCPAKFIDDAPAAGMLHDIGKLVLAINLPDQYNKVLALVREKNISPCEAEQEVFHETHAEVGAYLMGLWGIPEPVIEAIAFHHAPSKCQAKTFTLVTALHVANAMGARVSPHEGRIEMQLDYAYITELGLSKRLSFWQESCMGPMIK